MFYKIFEEFVSIRAAQQKDIEFPAPGFGDLRKGDVIKAKKTPE